MLTEMGRYLMAWGDGSSMSTHGGVNSGFWDLPGDERAEIEQAACERYGVSDFFDLDPEQRRAVYDSVTA